MILIQTNYYLYLYFVNLCIDYILQTIIPFQPIQKVFFFFRIVINFILLKYKLFWDKILLLIIVIEILKLHRYLFLAGSLWVNQNITRRFDKYHHLSYIQFICLFFFNIFKLIDVHVAILIVYNYFLILIMKNQKNRFLNILWNQYNNFVNTILDFY